MASQVQVELNPNISLSYHITTADPPTHRGHQEAGADTGGESNKVTRKVKEGEEALDSTLC